MTEEPARQRKNIHVDMDAFFASVEQQDNPELAGLPVAVGSPPRGVEGHQRIFESASLTIVQVVEPVAYRIILAKVDLA